MKKREEGGVAKDDTLNNYNADFHRIISKYEHDNETIFEEEEKEVFSYEAN